MQMLLNELISLENTILAAAVGDIKSIEDAVDAAISNNFGAAFVKAQGKQPQYLTSISGSRTTTKVTASRARPLPAFRLKLQKSVSTPFMTRSRIDPGMVSCKSVSFPGFSGCKFQ